MSDREIDDVTKRNNYKKAILNGKKSTIDEYEAKRIFEGNKKDAIRRHPSNKTTDTDHITPIAVVENRYGDLSKEQQTKLANNEKYNYALTNSKLNRSKRGLENHEYLLRKVKKVTISVKNGDFSGAGEKGTEVLKLAPRMLSKEAKSRARMAVDGNYYRAVNAKDKLSADSKRYGDSFAAGATEALTGALIPLTVEAVSQMCKVASGEKSLGEAAGDMAKYTVGTAVVGGARRLIVDQANFMMTNSGNPLFQKIASSGQIGQITAVALIVADSAERYLNGEIDGREFIAEIGEKGTMMVAGMIGGEIGSEIGTFLGLAAGGLVGAAAGKVIGKVLGTVITTAACSGIILVSSAVKDIRETVKHLDDYRKKERELAMIRTEALAEMERQREKFRAICAEEFGRWDETFAEGFDRIMESACEGVYSAKGVAEGLDEILRIFGRSVRFGTVEEYEAQLDSALVLQF